jgi:hypothetical protein
MEPPLHKNANALLGTAQGNILAALDILDSAAAKSFRPKPALADLREIKRRLEVARDAINKTVGGQ